MYISAIISWLYDLICLHTHTYIYIHSTDAFISPSSPHHILVKNLKARRGFIAQASRKSWMLRNICSQMLPGWDGRVGDSLIILFSIKTSLICAWSSSYLVVELGSSISRKTNSIMEDEPMAFHWGEHRDRCFGMGGVVWQVGVPCCEGTEWTAGTMNGSQLINISNGGLVNLKVSNCFTVSE